MVGSTIRFMSFPRTEPPPHFVPEIIAAFRKHESAIATGVLQRHLKSDDVLRIVAPYLSTIGFQIEVGKTVEHIIDRPVFFGEDGKPTLRFEVDGYHSEGRCGLEVEATRGIRGGAFYRDLVQAMVMVGVDHLCVAVPNKVEWGKSGRSRDYQIATETAQALYGHSRLAMPYGLTIIGY